jgi:hypothetical protein
MSTRNATPIVQSHGIASAAARHDELPKVGTRATQLGPKSVTPGRFPGACVHAVRGAPVGRARREGERPALTDHIRTGRPHARTNRGVPTPWISAF